MYMHTILYEKCKINTFCNHIIMHVEISIQDLLFFNITRIENLGGSGDEATQYKHIHVAPLKLTIYIPGQT